MKLTVSPRFRISSSSPQLSVPDYVVQLLPRLQGGHEGGRALTRRCRAVAYLVRLEQPILAVRKRTGLASIHLRRVAQGYDAEAREGLHIDNPLQTQKADQPCGMIRGKDDQNEGRTKVWSSSCLRLMMLPWTWFYMDLLISPHRPAGFIGARREAMAQQMLPLGNSWEKSGATVPDS